MENKNGKIMFSVLAIAIILIILVGITYAFFNYTRTGSGNIIKTGRIYFNSEQGTSINLTNMFPIDVTDGVPNDNTKVGTVTINVVGDTDYSGGIEYLIRAVDVYNTVGIGSSQKSVPISVEVSYSANGDGKVIGVLDQDYFTNRGGNSSLYKILAKDEIKENDQLVVGYIASGETGIDGNIQIRAYLDASKIAISDTYDGEESDNNGTTTNWVNGRVVLTTSEWNSLQQNGVSFKIKVEANEGIWVGEPLYNQIIKNVDTNTLINFGNISSSTNGEGLYILLGTEDDDYPIYYYRGAVTNNNVIFGDYCWQIVRTTDTGGIKMIYNGEATGNGTTCENTTAESRQLASTSVFNSQYQSVADVGYMKNTRYPYQSTSPTSGAYYGTSIEYGEYDTSNPGTNVYRLVDDGNGSVGTTLDADHHYSCDSVAATGTCTTIRYYYYVSGTTYRYINLTGGETVEDALYKMTGNGDAETKARNSSYVLNNTDSTAKTAIESWFRANLTTEVDNTKRNYGSYLEDTVYCNDRSFKTETGHTSYPTYLESGWNPNGGALTTNLLFGTNNRKNNEWYSTTNVPSTTCPNETDRFSVSSSVAHLNYPVGLLTVDEIIMAGASGNSGGTNNNAYYLYTGNYYWTLSPVSFINVNAYESIMTYWGFLDSARVLDNFGLRPVVSLKHGTEFESGGDGTPTNPYVVKYN